MRTCPLCRSKAIRATHTEELESTRVRVLVQCGQCDALRLLDMRPRAMAAFERHRRHDLARMERLVGQLEQPPPTTTHADASER